MTSLRGAIATKESSVERAVMRGLDPRIQAPRLTMRPRCLDGRVKPGHDVPVLARNDAFRKRLTI
jgi:hypothetical protein